MPTNERGPGMRLSSGPEHSLLTNRPVIVTQSDLPSSSPPPLQQRGSPYSELVDKLVAICGRFANRQYVTAGVIRPLLQYVTCAYARKQFRLGEQGNTMLIPVPLSHRDY